MTSRALLTGGIGSGKSTAAGMLAALGATVISADEAGHRVLEPGGAAASRVAARWPEAMVGDRIDRRTLGRIVFADPEALADLEAITHPEIAVILVDEVERAAGSRLVVVEMPVLIDLLGSGWLRVVVDAPDDLRVQRLLDRGMEEAEISARMSMQPPRSVWLDAADVVIDNGGGLSELEEECRRVWDELTA